jgi:hypothetical protein
MYSSPNINRGTKLRIIREVVQAACMGERRGAHRVLVGIREGKKALERSRRGWRITSEWIFKKRDG